MTYEWKIPENLHSVAWRMGGKFQRTYHSVAWRMSGKFQRTYSNVAWRMSGKFQRTYSNVAWRMSGKFQRTYSSHREACPSSASSHERYYMPHTRAYMHLPAATDKHVLLPQVYMNVITCPTPPNTPPHPTTPMCTKHHGLLKAVVQLFTVLLVFSSKMSKIWWYSIRPPGIPICIIIF